MKEGGIFIPLAEAKAPEMKKWQLVKTERGIGGLVGKVLIYTLKTKMKSVV